MRRIAICCLLSLLMIVAVGRAAPVGPHRASKPRPAVGGHAVLFGNPTIQRTVGRTRSGRPEAFPFAVQRAGTVSAIRVYLDAHNKSKRLMVAVYSSRSGKPLRRVASGTLSSPKSGAWNKVHVSRAKVASHATYWIALLGRGGMLYFRDRNSRSCHAIRYGNAHMTSMPPMWAGKTRLNACPISAYAIGRATKTSGSGTTFGTITPPGPAPPASTGAPASQVGGPTPGGVVCTTTLNAGANVQGVVSSAAPGSVVCLNAGSWSAIRLSGIAPAAPGVTLAASPGQSVVVPGFTITGSDTQNLTVEGFKITVPATKQTDGGNASNGIELLCGIAGGVTLEYNTIENQPGGNGIYVYPGYCGSGHTQSGVTIAYNQIDHVATGLEMDGNVSTQLNWVVSHNVIGPGIQDGEYGHYVQIQGISGLTMNNNAFEGPPDPSYEDCAANGSASHLNVVHIDTGGQRNVTLDNNIIWHSQTCGDTVLIQDSPTDNIQIENNLDVEDPACATMTPYTCDANPFVVQAPHGLTFNHNTLANVERGSAFGGTCGTCYSDPQNMTAEYNIATPTIPYDVDYNLWKCISSCTTQDNASSDTSANTVLGGPGNVVKWTPSWKTTSWTPVNGPGYQPPRSGYYQPNGLAITGAGYQGQIGP